MTYEAAFQKIEDLWRIVSEHKYLFSDDFSKVVCMAVEALEKQIPKELKIEKSNLSCFEDYFCPCCHNKIISKLDDNWICGKQQFYCDKCGQALDWRKSNGSKSEIKF